MAKGFTKSPKPKIYPYPIINVLHLGRIKPNSSDVFWAVIYDSGNALIPEVECIAAKNKKQVVQKFLDSQNPCSICDIDEALELVEGGEI